MLNNEFRAYGIDYDYDNEYSCEESGCNIESICRCGVIVDLKITSININIVIDQIYDIYYNYKEKSKGYKRNIKINKLLYGYDNMELYIIDRIARHCKLYEIDNWEARYVGGYYGEEVDGVYLNDMPLKKLKTHIDNILDLSIPDMVRYVINLEYGHILPELMTCGFNVESVNKNKILFGSNSQLDNVKKEDLSHYKKESYDGIRGIVIKNNEGYRLIDGYHRVSAIMDDFYVDNINVLVAKYE